jgi:hypothetical protein
MTSLLPNTPLHHKLQIFIHDLRKYSDHVPSAERLNSTTSPDYISLPYFTASEAALIRSHKSGDGDKTVEQVLEKYFQERGEKGNFAVCTSHDLAPLFERAFRVDARGLVRDKGFKERVKRVDRWGMGVLGCAED